MSEILEEKQSFLNFSFLTAAFYNFVVVSGDNFLKIKYAQNDDKFEQEFDNLNKDNFFNYLDNLSSLHNNDEQIKQTKIKLIKSIFNLDFYENKKEKIFLELKEKMTISIFSNKNKLIKLLSNQIINFIFEIYELIYLIIKNMEKSRKEIIQQMKSDNLIKIDKLKKDNGKNEELENEIIKLKEKMKNIENNIKNKIEEEIKKSNNLLIKEIEHRKKMEEEIKKANNLLIKEIENIKTNQNLAEENYQYMKNLNLDILKGEISLNEGKFDKYKETINNLKKDNCELKLQLDNCNIEISKKDFEISCLNKLNGLFCKDYQHQIDQLKEEIELLKKPNLVNN